MEWIDRDYKPMHLCGDLEQDDLRKKIEGKGQGDSQGDGMPVIWEKDGSRMETIFEGSLDTEDPVGIADIELKDGREYGDSGSVRYRLPKPEYDSSH